MNTLFNLIKDDPLKIVIYLASFYGLRRSEVLGLKWSAFDFVNNTITIKHKVVETIVEDKRTLLMKDKTKICKKKKKNKQLSKSEGRLNAWLGWSKQYFSHLFIIFYIFSSFAIHIEKSTLLSFYLLLLFHHITYFYITFSWCCIKNCITSPPPKENYFVVKNFFKLF